MKEFEQILNQISYVSYNVVLDELLRYLVDTFNAEEAIFCFFSQSKDIINLAAKSSRINSNALFQNEVCKQLSEYNYLSEFTKDKFLTYDLNSESIKLPFVNNNTEYAMIQAIEFGTVTSGFFLVTRNNEEFTLTDSQILLFYAKMARSHLKL